MGGKKLIFLFTLIFLIGFMCVLSAEDEGAETQTQTPKIPELPNEFNPEFWNSYAWQQENALSQQMWIVSVWKDEYFGALEKSKIYNISIMSDNSSLENFTSAKTELQKARDELDSAKLNINNLRPGFDIFKAFQCIEELILVKLGFTSEDLESIPTCAELDVGDIDFYLGVFPNSYQSALSHSFNVLEHSINAVNSVYSKVNDEFVLLEYMGAGYENYNGAARQTYNKVVQIMDVVSYQNASDINPNLENISSHYSENCQNIIDIRDELNMEPPPPGPDFKFLNSLPVVVESLVGDNENNLILKGVALYNEVVEAKQIMNQEYGKLKNETKRVKVFAKSALDELTNEKVSKIKSIPTEYVIPTEETPEDSLYYSDEELTEKYTRLKSLKVSADSFYIKGKVLYPSETHYVAKGIERLIIANATYVEIEEDSIALKEEFIDLVNWMKERAETKLIACENSITSADPNSQLLAIPYRDDAQEEMEDAGETLGEKYEAYSEAYNLASDCVSAANGDWEDLILTKKRLLSNLKAALDAAEKDEIEDLETYWNWYYYHLNSDVSNADAIVLDKIIAIDKPREFKRLDVTVFNYLVLKDILGIDVMHCDNISYMHNAQEAISVVDKGKADLLFMLNPIKIEQLLKVASAFEKMPPKSTFFYPKILTGLTIHKFD